MCIRDRQWDELIVSEMAYVNAVQEISHLTEEVDPSTTMQEQLRPMLRLILDNESNLLLSARLALGVLPCHLAARDTRNLGDYCSRCRRSRCV